MNSDKIARTKFCVKISKRYKAVATQLFCLYYAYNPLDVSTVIARKFIAGVFFYNAKNSENYIINYVLNKAFSPLCWALAFFFFFVKFLSKIH